MNNNFICVSGTVRDFWIDDNKMSLSGVCVIDDTTEIHFICLNEKLIESRPIKNGNKIFLYGKITNISNNVVIDTEEYNKE